MASTVLVRLEGQSMWLIIRGGAVDVPRALFGYPNGIGSQPKRRWIVGNVSRIYQCILSVGGDYKTLHAVNRRGKSGDGCSG